MGLWDNDVERMLESFCDPVAGSKKPGELTFPLDVSERNNEFLITAELPA